MNVMNMFFYVFAATIMFTAASCSSTSNGTQADDSTEQTATARIIPADADGTVHELTNVNLYTPDARVAGLTVLYFNAIWSGPCRQLDPIVAEMAEEYKDKVTFVSVNTDNFPSVLEAYAPGVPIPLIVILRPDGITETISGTAQLLPASKFEALISSHL